MIPCNQKEAQINDRKQLVQNFDNLLTEQWPCSQDLLNKFLNSMKNNVCSPQKKQHGSRKSRKMFD